MSGNSQGYEPRNQSSEGSDFAQEPEYQERFFLHPLFSFHYDMIWFDCLEFDVVLIDLYFTHS